jgi:hypothetical protein
MLYRHDSTDVVMDTGVAYPSPSSALHSMSGADLCDELSLLLSFDDGSMQSMDPEPQAPEVADALASAMELPPDPPVLVRESAHISALTLEEDRAQLYCSEDDLFTGEMGDPEVDRPLPFGNTQRALW